MMRAVISLQGSQRRQITPITRFNVNCLMMLRGLTIGKEHDVAITVAGTQLCARVGEIKRLQVYDLLPNYDVAFSRRYCGSAAIQIRKRKQDQQRKWLYPRLMKGFTKTLCIVKCLQAMVAKRGLAVSAECTKRRRPAARCPLSASVRQHQK
jgi:hypothetical protein